MGSRAGGKFTIKPKFDEARVRAVVQKVVDRKVALFAAYKEISPEDLAAEGMMAARRGWRRFDPAKSKFSTFVYLCASRRLLTMSRDLGRRANRERKGMELRAGQLKPEREREAPSDLAEWLGQTHRSIRLIYQRMLMPLRPPRASKRYPDRAQRAALLLLKNRLGASCRALELVLRQHPELLRAIDLPAALSYRTLHRLEKSVTRSAKGMPAEVRV